MSETLAPYNAEAPPDRRSADAASLARKILKVQEACAYVKKDGRNDFHKYNYASAAGILLKVNPAMVEHGVMAFPEYDILSTELIERLDRDGNKRAPERLVTVQCRLSVVDAETGYTIVVRAIGCGQDNMDKAVMKAETAAHKYAWMGLLNISTGDDPEADAEADKRNAPPKSQPTMPQRMAPAVPAGPRRAEPTIEPTDAAGEVAPDGVVTMPPMAVLAVIDRKGASGGLYWEITTDSGKLSTNSAVIGKVALVGRETGKPVVFQYRAGKPKKGGGFFHDLTGARLWEPQAVDDDGDPGPEPPPPGDPMNDPDEYPPL